MLIHRAHIYIFGIPNHHRLMPCTRFFGVQRLPAEKSVKTHRAQLLIVTKSLNVLFLFLQISAKLDNRVDDEPETFQEIGKSGMWKGTDFHHMIDQSFGASLVTLLKGIIHMRCQQNLWIIDLLPPLSEESVHCGASTQSCSFVLFLMGSTCSGCTVATVSAHRPVENVKNT